MSAAATATAPISVTVQDPGPRPAAYQPRLRNDTMARPPLMYAGGNVSKLEGFDEHAATLQPAVGALDAMHAALAGVIEARSKSDRDPELGTEGAKVLKVAAYADKLMDGATRKVDQASQHIAGQIRSVEADLTRAVSGAVNNPLAAEIRAHAKAHKSPTQFVSELIAAGDEQGVSAVLGAPAYLSGLTAEMREALTRQWNTKRQPALTARLTLLKATQDRLDRAGAAFIVNVEKAMGVSYSTVKRLRDEKTAASFG